MDISRNKENNLHAAFVEPSGLEGEQNGEFQILIDSFLYDEDVS